MWMFGLSVGIPCMQDQMNEPGGQIEEIAVVVVRRGQEVLVGRRPYGVPWGGYWEFPGGKVRSGESPAEAAIRECKEETGYSVRILRSLVVTEQKAREGLQRLHFFLAELFSPDTQLPEDQAYMPAGACDECKAEFFITQMPNKSFYWHPISRLKELEFPPANRRVLEILLGE
jgi:8-oxo-dGTP diphosphatase